MINAIDQNQDYSNKELFNFLSEAKLPTFVKEASISEAKSPKDLSSTAFADPASRLFPINSKVRIYVSNSYFVNKKAELVELKGQSWVDKVQTHIEKAAKDFGILEHVKEYNDSVAYFDKKASANVEHTFVVNIPSHDTELEIFNVKSAGELVNTAGEFAKNIDNFPYDWRRPICDYFVKAAEALNVDELPDLVLKYAGQYYPNIEEVRNELTRRCRKYEDKEKVAVILDAVNAVASNEDLFKLADCCYYMEKEAGLYDHNDMTKILGDPVDKLFTLHFDKAAHLMNCIEISGERFAVEDLEKISSDIYEQAFGFKLDPRSKEAREVLPTMPRSDLILFKELSGIKPI